MFVYFVKNEDFVNLDNITWKTYFLESKQTSQNIRLNMYLKYPTIALKFGIIWKRLYMLNCLQCSK